MSNEYSIAIMLPTRGRAEALSRSVFSLINLAKDVSRIQFLFAIDNDDEIGLDHFISEIQPKLDELDIAYEAKGFESLGYTGLNRYYNSMAESADADWLVVWNDDAIMETQDWDERIVEHTGEFKILKVHTHNDHPYSIFPIIPKEWLSELGYLSRHQMIDAEISQIAYMMDIMEIIDVHCEHDRADLTGNNNDETDKKRIRYEGNPSSPLDFHHTTYTGLRHRDCDHLEKYMNGRGIDTSFWVNVKTGKQDPWEKLKINDVNNQMVQHRIRQV